VKPRAAVPATVANICPREHLDRLDSTDSEHHESEGFDLGVTTAAKPRFAIRYWPEHEVAPEQKPPRSTRPNLPHGHR